MTSEQTYLAGLVARAQSHDGAAHVFFDRLAEGRVPDVTAGLRHFAFQFRQVLRYRPRFLRAVTRSLIEPRHKAVFEAILEEEMGPRAQAFERFEAAIGIDRDYRARHRVLPEAEALCAVLLDLTTRRESICGVGAMGLAGELVRPMMLSPLSQAVEQYTDLPGEVLAFFQIDQPAALARREAVFTLTAELLEDDASQQALEQAVIRTLEARMRFWRALLMVKPG